LSRRRFTVGSCCVPSSPRRRCATCKIASSESPVIPHVSVIVHLPNRYRGESIKSIVIWRSMDSGRIYRHFCMMARALEVVGEHWSLLIVRDLLLGPQRFTDLARSLQEITPTRLTNRLRQLEAAGVVTREPQTSGGRFGIGSPRRASSSHRWWMR